MKLFKNKQEKYKKYLNDFRKLYIPKDYNQILLMDDLLDESIDHYISISSRADGKTFNYLHFLISLSLRENFKFIIISRTFMMRKLIRDQIFEIFKTFDDLKIEDLSIVNQHHYDLLFSLDKEIAMVTDLNETSNLKLSSGMLSEYDMIVYDEFLTQTWEYQADEYEMLKTLYSSMDRRFNPKENELFHHPKILYLGNAVNLDSPILSGLEVLEILEDHPLNTKAIYGNISLELLKNDKQNQKRNLRAFKETNDKLSSAEFNFNKMNIASKSLKTKISLDPCEVIIKDTDRYIKINYKRGVPEEIILSVVYDSPKYDYNIEVKDNSSSSIFLKDSYFSNNQKKKFEKNLFYFSDTYSREYILSSPILTSLKIFRIVGEHQNKIQNMGEIERGEEDIKLLKQKKEELYKQELFEKLMGGIYESSF